MKFIGEKLDLSNLKETKPKVVNIDNHFNYKYISVVDNNIIIDLSNTTVDRIGTFVLIDTGILVKVPRFFTLHFDYDTEHIPAYLMIDATTNGTIHARIVTTSTNIGIIKLTPVLLRSGRNLKVSINNIDKINAGTCVNRDQSLWSIDAPVADVLKNDETIKITGKHLYVQDTKSFIKGVTLIKPGEQVDVFGISSGQALRICNPIAKTPVEFEFTKISDKFLVGGNYAVFGEYKLYKKLVERIRYYNSDEYKKIIGQFSDIAKPFVMCMSKKALSTKLDSIIDYFKNTTSPTASDIEKNIQIKIGKPSNKILQDAMKNIEEYDEALVKVDKNQIVGTIKYTSIYNKNDDEQSAKRIKV